MSGPNRMLFIACGASTVGGLAPAVAQESGAMIEEVVVTALKREESLQTTPASVTAFTAEAIDALGFRQSVDVTAQAPNFSVGFRTATPASRRRSFGASD